MPTRALSSGRQLTLHALQAPLDVRLVEPGGAPLEGGQVNSWVLLFETVELLQTLDHRERETGGVVGEPRWIMQQMCVIITATLDESLN